MEIHRLSDDELAEKLRSYGENIGPVIDSTRKVYERMLERLMKGETWQAPTFEAEDYSDEDQPDSPVIAQVTRETRSGNYKPDVRYRVMGEPATYETTPMAYTSVKDNAPRRTNSAKTQQNSSSKTTAAEVPSQKKGGMSICIQLCILAVVAALIFLILMNMEPAAKATIGDIHN